MNVFFKRLKNTQHVKIEKGHGNVHTKIHVGTFFKTLKTLYRVFLSKCLIFYNVPQKRSILE